MTPLNPNASTEEVQRRREGGSVGGREEPSCPPPPAPTDPQGAPEGTPPSGVLMAAASVLWPLTQRRVLVAGVAEYEALLSRLLGDAESAANVAGVLVDPRGAHEGA
eukprot:351112-Chlamydomonas_euryale.AAC.4